MESAVHLDFQTLDLVAQYLYATDQEFKDAYAYARQLYVDAVCKFAEAFVFAGRVTIPPTKPKIFETETLLQDFVYDRNNPLIYVAERIPDNAANDDILFSLKEDIWPAVQREALLDEGFRKVLREQTIREHPNFHIPERRALFYPDPPQLELDLPESVQDYLLKAIQDFWYPKGKRSEFDRDREIEFLRSNHPLHYERFAWYRKHFPFQYMPGVTRSKIEFFLDKEHINVVKPIVERMIPCVAFGVLKTIDESDSPLSLRDAFVRWKQDSGPELARAKKYMEGLQYETDRDEAMREAKEVAALFDVREKFMQIQQVWISLSPGISLRTASKVSGDLKWVLRFPHGDKTQSELEALMTRILKKRLNY